MYNDVAGNNQKQSAKPTTPIYPGFYGVFGACWNFRDKDEGPSNRVTAIIMPRRVYSPHPNEVRLTWACSLGRFCRMPYCLYSSCYYQHHYASEEDDGNVGET
jgi:hypothetical protein